MSDYHPVADGIFTVSDLFTADECDRYIALAEQLGFGDAPVTTPGGPVRITSIRNNDRVMLDDPRHAAVLWERIAPYVSKMHYAGSRPTGVNERLRFYRYDPGQAFRWHRDGSYQDPAGRRSFVTYMVYLNDDFEGGQTKFREPHPLEVKPVKGMALLFSHPLSHEGAAVKTGRKYVLRTDVMYENDLGPYLD
jgi:hypothetical protein